MRKGWISVKFRDCIKLKSGDNLTSKKMVSSGEIPVYGGNGIAGTHDSHNRTGENIIIGRVGAQCGNVKIIDQPIWLTDNAFYISELKYSFDNYFLTYLLNFLDLRSYARQTAQPVISNSSLKNVELVFPELLSEQKQIVAILDEAFEAIDRAKANIEKNIQNAEELFQSKLEEIFLQRGEGWEEKTLGSVSDFQNGFAFKSKTYKEAGTPIIRIRDIQDGVIELSHIVYIDRNDYGKDLSKYEISKGDLLIAMSGATTGKIGIVEIDDTFLLNQRVGKFEPGKKLDKGYLYYYLSTKVEEALKISAGSAQPNLSTNQIKDFLIPLPPIRQQEIIVNELNDLSDKIDFFKDAYLNKIKGLEELKKSILQKAFSGELTAKEQVAV